MRASSQNYSLRPGGANRRKWGRAPIPSESGRGAFVRSRAGGIHPKGVPPERSGEADAFVSLFRGLFAPVLS